MSRRTVIELPPREQRPQAPGEERAVQALQAAQDFYERSLHENYDARAYLEERGITYAVAQEEGIGYDPAGWDPTIQHLQGAGFRPELLEAAGLATPSQRGTMIDFLRDRITVPIRDTRGRVIAFGGRVMPGAPPDAPKYMNTKETPLFRKSDVVFHLHRAKGFLRASGAVLVEGYFDTIRLCAHGVQEAVAPLGTALTEGHLQALRRWTNRLTLIMDGDDAGQLATHKALKLALPAGFEVRILTLPVEHDPDTWARAMGGKTKAAITAAPDWATFALDRAKAGKDLRRMEDRLAAAHEVAEWISYLPGPRRSHGQAESRGHRRRCAGGCGCTALLRRGGRYAQPRHRRHPAQRQDRLGARAPRGSRRLRRGRRSVFHRPPDAVCRQLRTGQPALHQRHLRVAPQPRSGGFDRESGGDDRTRRRFPAGS